MHNYEEKRKEKNTKNSFVSVLIREFWGLTKLNLCFVLYSLPVITLGAALAAMHRVTRDMANDIPTDPVYDFNRYFKSAFPRTIKITLTIVASFGFSAFSSFVYFYSAIEKDMPLLYIPAVTAFVYYLFTCILGIFDANFSIFSLV